MRGSGIKWQRSTVLFYYLGSMSNLERYCSK